MKNNIKYFFYRWLDYIIIPVSILLIFILVGCAGSESFVRMTRQEE